MKVGNKKLSIDIVSMGMGIALICLGSIVINNVVMFSNISVIVPVLAVTLSICCVGIGAILFVSSICSLMDDVIYMCDKAKDKEKTNG